MPHQNTSVVRREFAQFWQYCKAKKLENTNIQPGSLGKVCCSIVMLSNPNQNQEAAEN